MKRVVITGIGVVASLGNNKEEVTESLRNGRSGIVTAPDYIKHNFRSQVHGSIKNLDFKELIPRKQLRFMGDAAAYSYIAMDQAIKDAGLTEEQYSNPMTGIIAGSGGGSNSNSTGAVETTKTRGAKKVGPYMVTRTMGSTVSACLATPFKIKGLNFSITSACSTSAHCIGTAFEQIQMGKQDMIFAGGGEELDWTMSVMFDGMGAMSSKYNNTPELSSRAYDTNRDGFVIAGGGGMIVVEELSHALKRGAKIYAEITGYCANSDGYDMVAPSGEGAVRCMQGALSTVKGKIDYINPHGTSTPVGDTKEINAIKQVFGENVPKISSTKSMSGHSLGAAGVHEAIYSLLMMEHDFIAPSINIDNLDPECEGMPIVTTLEENAGINRIMSNSFGFGGTNASLIMEKYKS